MYSAALINDPFGDSGVYVENKYRREALLFDLGDLLFIETTFLQDDMETAAWKYHLTAWQAGRLSRQAHVKRMVPFHFSPKYKSAPHVLFEEAMKVFRGDPA